MSSGGHIPDKLYFRIGEVTEITGLAAYVLRFWESELPTINPKRTESGQRLYRKSDIEAILEIKHLLYDRKFTIEGAIKHLKQKPKQTARPNADPILSEIRAELEAILKILED
ncbi:MAG: MerR family transcriptional regulator [Desulfobacteraceae bacterium]|nr:MerR family transcriptional regulator [Desulfobacteraceae bacterium]MCF8095657.1 MerR family transcriptional regulator [Desulfobacteraceae bacterium]